MTNNKVFTDGLQNVFLMAFVVVVLGILISYLLPHNIGGRK